MNRTVDKFCVLCYTFNKSESGWEYWNELLESYKDDEDYFILKSKMDKTLNLLNKNENDIIYLDVEKELYDRI
jgi:hypothetical protein